MSRRQPVHAGGSARITIGRIALDLPTLPGIPPERFASALEARLATLRIDGPPTSRRVDRVTLPEIRAMRGEGPESLATRIADAVGRALNDDGGKP